MRIRESKGTGTARPRNYSVPRDLRGRPVPSLGRNAARTEHLLRRNHSNRRCVNVLPFNLPDASGQLLENMMARPIWLSGPTFWSLPAGD
jgi:hypothetical protein